MENMQYPVLALGFRPFFLLAALVSAIWIPLWMLFFYGLIRLEPALPGSLWHGHEMIFGYAGAVIAGFLLTAVRNWTGEDTAVGAWLGGLVVLWMLSRVMNLVVGLPPVALAIIDPLFFLFLAVGLFRPLWRTGNRRNLPMVVIVLLFGALDCLTHLGDLGGTGWPAQNALRVAVDLVAVLMVLIGGRVIAMFTRNAVPEAPVHRVAWFDRLAIGGVVAALVMELVFGLEPLTAAVFVLAGLANILRLSTWGGLATLQKPILWVLHLGYLWIGIGLLLRGASVFVAAVPEDMGLHALTAGAIGTLTLGMMTRVSLGHTGRPIVAPRVSTIGFVLVSLSALIRMLGSVLSVYHDALVVVSAGLWALAFAAFLLNFFPILTAPRADGKPG
ncbi:MAG: NnrS family protein [Alphaproteobacteria bacterium]|nr:MAG: NnrS family protein [Alphaproteobacteria bacterium]